MRINVFYRFIIGISAFLSMSLLFGAFGVSLLSVEATYTPQLVLPGKDYSLVYTTGDSLSHLLLWHNLDHQITNAKKADIIILGNSRTQLGLTSSILIPRLKHIGLSVFWFSTGHNEKYSFFNELFKKYKISNKIIIIQDEILNGDRLSSPARKALQSSKWEGIKQVYETRLSWEIQRALHKIFPKLFFSSVWFSTHILYRSQKYGDWHDCFANTRQKRFLVSHKEMEIDLTPSAVKFIDYLKRLNNKIVIISTPNSACSYVEAARSISKKLNVSYIPPTNKDLYTYDRSHLRSESAAEYTIDFLEKFEIWRNSVLP